ncbi:hypothetical protein FNV43_RR19398 [Rhamnella rubrinervis]|uniref:Uncharacterized protein n=1 Tax=Rhamnella rubrinervis TaxID=2594499 RepID=A0A8K0DXP9_9ROSA|nr:hypothetical protein FNV43_RR19398 [Rhamnella rubrinervis]
MGDLIAQFERALVYVMQVKVCEKHCGGRNYWNSMKESREPGCMPVSYDQVEWHKICLLAYVEILIPPHNNLILILAN